MDGFFDVNTLSTGGGNLDIERMELFVLAAE